VGGSTKFARLTVLVCGVALAVPAAQAQLPDTVRFDSADGKTELVGYLYKPTAAGPHPAVVALHGRTGLYSNGASRYDATTLSARHKMWGEFWAARGFAVLLVDTFGPRGHPAGFAAGTRKQRPRDVNEITVRPLDAYAGLAYLRARSDIVQDQVYLQGWSNGGSAALSAMAVGAPGLAVGARGFRAALALYPACTPVTEHYGRQYRTYAPVLLLIGDADEEVKPANCAVLANYAVAHGSDFDYVSYAGATHGYDSPAPNRQRIVANAAAAADTKHRAEAFFALHRSRH
jgi:dienelactone hydrolase